MRLIERAGIVMPMAIANPTKAFAHGHRARALR
jgi:hypothetical protein